MSAHLHFQDAALAEVLAVSPLLAMAPPGPRLLPTWHGAGAARCGFPPVAC
jgi:hypothetical protein